MALITCKDLALGYDGTAIMKHINFDVQRGDYLYIVGENGSGKSTLMKTLLHLIRPVHGQILTGEGLKSYEIGYLPQQTELQKDFPASVWEIVLSGMLSKCRWRFFYGNKEKQEAERNMKRMNVWELRKKCYKDLSGGQQQRVLLSRALCATSELLLLDEPVTGLDPKVTAEFYQLIEDLHEQGTTIIMISHDMEATNRYATHILHMGGDGYFYGTKKAYLQSESWIDFANMNTNSAKGVSIQDDGGDKSGAI